MLQLPPNPPNLRLPLDWHLRAAGLIGYVFPKVGWREEDCKTCLGTKTVRTWEYAPLDSDVVTYPCNCVEQMLLYRYLGMRGITKVMATKGFKDLRWVDLSVREKLKVWNDDPAERARHTSGIVLSGGSGKTLMATLLQRMLFMSDINSFMVTTQMFNPDGPIFNWKAEAYEEIQEFWNKVMKPAPVMVIDRLEGGTMITDWGKAKIDALLRYRMENELMTVITTQSVDRLALALPSGSDVVRMFETINVIAEPYPWAEIHAQEIEKKIIRPVVMG